MEEKIIKTLLGKKVDLTDVNKKELRGKVKTLLCALTIAQEGKKGYDEERRGVIYGY
ncbi:MAG: hypothetical protein IJW73_05520 [Candidatus Gastranaerophilales bacterium]|nr:hypothetical protein [Candidatus Gastranaerophilales bacterium]